MKKILPIFLILCFCLVGCSNKNESPISKEENTSYNYNATRTKATDNNYINNSVSQPKTNPETELASFSTKIYTPNDNARQNNITLTCSKLNETIVKSRRNLFFL